MHHQGQIADPLLPMQVIKKKRIVKNRLNKNNKDGRR